MSESKGACCPSGLFPYFLTMDLCPVIICYFPPLSLPFTASREDGTVSKLMTFSTEQCSIVKSRATGWMSSSPCGGKNFSIFHVVQTGSGSHSASYPMGTGGKAAGA
jgi:hypothetical protein